MPTLPFIGEPQLWLFFFMDYFGEALAEVLLLITFVVATSFHIWRICLAVYQCCVKKNHEAMSTETTSVTLNRKHECLTKCRGGFTWVSRKLNVKMYPGLFKEHKDRNLQVSGSGYSWITRQFMVFLDRKVEDNAHIILNFYFLASAILFSALLVFFRYVPIGFSRRCITTDDNDRDVFCYTSESTYPLKLPVDCDTYNTTELKAIEFSCYTISIFDVAVAVAAAMALVELAILGITIYIRVSEGCYKWSKHSTSRWITRCYRFYHVIGFTLMIVISVLSYLAVSLIIKSRVETAEEHTSKRGYLAYAILPIMLIFFLIAIVLSGTLSKHFDREEYTSHCKYQLPINVKDCDVHVGPPHRGIVVTDIDNETILVHSGIPPSYVTTEQAERVSYNSNIAPNSIFSGLVISNLSTYTSAARPPLDLANTSPQLPDSQV